MQKLKPIRQNRLFPQPPPPQLETIKLIAIEYLLSTLRGTPPQHLLVVDLLWNDPAKFEFCFEASVAYVAFTVSAGGSWSPFWKLSGFILGAKIVHFGFLGGPWHLEKPNPEK